MKIFTRIFQNKLRTMSFLLLGGLTSWSAQAQTYSNLSVSGTPVCANGTFTVFFNVTGGTASSYTARLSNKNGGFGGMGTASLGTVVAGINNTVTVPANSPSGTAYQVRIEPNVGSMSAEFPAGFEIYELNIGTITVSNTPACANGTLGVQFSIANGCTYPSGTTFTARLSNENGNFGGGSDLGTITPNTLTNFTLPANQAGASSYRVRILPSNGIPPTGQLPESSDFTINALNIGTITVSNTPVCATGTIGVQFGIANSCSYPDGTTFVARLSNSNGGFNNGTSELGAITPNTLTNFTLPANQAGGSGYQVRIEPSNGIPPINQLPESSPPFTVYSLNIGTITVSNTPVCVNSMLGVQFSIANGCTYPEGTTFTARLSNSSGGFGMGATNLGAITPNTPTNFTVPANQPGGTSYRVRILPSNSIPPNSDLPESSTFTINVLPTVSFTGLDPSYCENASDVTLVGSPSGEGGTFSGPGVSGTTFSPAAAGDGGPYTITFSYTDPSTGCTNTTSQEVTVIQPSYTTQATVSGATVCAGATYGLSFDVNCPVNMTFSAELVAASGMPLGISLGSVSPSGNTVTIPVGTPTGSYRILVTGSNPTITTLSNAFSVTGLAANFNSSPTVSLTPACAGASIKVSFTVKNNPCTFPTGNVFTVQLSDASGSFAAPVTLGTVSPGITNVTIPESTPTGSGYRVRIAATADGSSAYSNVSAAFTVNQPSFAATPTVSLDNKCAGEAVRLSFNVACAFFGGNTFTAYLSDASGGFSGGGTYLGTVTPGALNNVTIPSGTAPGTTYKIRIVSSNPVVTSAASANFKVKACGGVSREAAPEELGLQVRVSPNPAPDGRLRIHVSGVEGQALKVALFNGVGQPVREQRLERTGQEDVLEWDIAHQPAGLYLLRVSGAKEAKTVKVLH